MKQIKLVTLATLASCAAFADGVPTGLADLQSAIQVSNVQFGQDMSTRDVVVNYTLGGQDAVVRADILTNGVSIGRQHIKTFTGEGYSQTADAVIPPGTHTFRWRARKDWKEQLVDDLQVKVCAFYPEEVSNALSYGGGLFLSEQMFKDDMTTESDPGWTCPNMNNLNTPGFTRNVNADGSGNMMLSVNGAEREMVTPNFGNLDYWRISFKTRVMAFYMTNSSAKFKYAIEGVDAAGNRIFRLDGEATSNGANAPSTIGGVNIQGGWTYSRLVLVHDSHDTFAVYGNSNGATSPVTLCTVAAPLANPDGKLAKIRFIAFVGGYVNGINGRIDCADITVEELEPL